ncbi:MAG: IS1634 family transposase [Gammaproteobacteria bacterium]|nr:IS1634 family transposase [Gammaproteobacteria bacterium]
MFVKVTKSGPRRYVQLVESYRDDDGRVRKRTIATLGRIEQLRDGALESVINGLAKLSGTTAPSAHAGEPPDIAFEPVRALGDVWALNELWNSLGFGELRRVFGRSRRRVDVETLLRVMVLNRLCDPESKLGVLRWLETVAIPGVDVPEVTHDRLLRAMDALMDKREAVDATVAKMLRPLIDQELSVVFYDLTTISVEGEAVVDGDVRKFGKSKDGGIRRQFMLGVVQTAQGLPLHHEVFDGNVAETKTLQPMLDTVLERFPDVRRVIVVADRGLLSLDNLEFLRGIRLRSGAPLEFILAVPARRYGEFATLLEDIHREHCEATEEPVAGESSWQGMRLAWHYDPVMAAQLTAKRAERIERLETLATRLAGKLEGQDEGKRSRGRSLSDGGATAQFYHEVSEARLGRIVRTDLKGKLFSYTIDEAALRHAQLADGKLLLVTNVNDLKPEDIVSRYKALADIERGFRVLKSELEIAPVFHRLPHRIRAHASVCFLALVLHRVMRMRLHASTTGLSPERALERLRRIQYHRIQLNDDEPLTGISSIDAQQRAVLAALEVRQPAASRQLSLL